MKLLSSLASWWEHLPPVSRYERGKARAEVTTAGVFRSVSHPCRAQKAAQGSSQICTQAPERYGGDFCHVVAEAVGWPGAPVVWA